MATITEKVVVTEGGSTTLDSEATYTCPPVAGNGGAVEVQTGGTITINGETTFNGNQVTGEGSKGGAIYNAGTVNMANTVTLATETDTVYNTGTLNWNLTGDTTGKLVGYQYLTNSDSGSLTITVKANGEQTAGSYVIATGDFTMDTLTQNLSTEFTVTDGDSTTDTITINGTAGIIGMQGYKIALKESETAGADQLVLTVINYTSDHITVDNTSTAEDPYTLKGGKTYTAKLYDGNGGAVEVQTGGNLTGENVTFADNETYVGGEGGAIYNNGGTVTLAGDATFNNNSSGISGGAIDNFGTVTLSNATFANNSTTNDGSGGAIYNNFSCAITINGDATFTNNNCVGEWGSSAGAICNFGTLTFNAGATFTGNTAAYNGAIATYGTLTFNDGATFNGNKTQNNGVIYNCGGAVLNFAGTMDLQTEDDTWVNKGLYQSSTEYFATVNWDLTGVTDAAQSTVFIKGFQRYSNQTTEVSTDQKLLVNQTITVKAEGAQKAGKYVIATGDFTMDTLTQNNSLNFTVTDKTNTTGTITVGGNEDYIDLQGYKIALVESETEGADQLVLTVTNYDEHITVTNASTADNPYELTDGKTYTAKPYAQGNGGAVEVQTGGNLTGENVTFAENSAKSGGAFYNSGTVTIKGDAIFNGNTATNKGQYVGGGAFYNNGGTVTIKGDATFSNNTTVLDGGALYNNGGTVSFEGDATFNDNSAPNSLAGAICLCGGTLSFAGDATFSNNTAGAGSGGAIKVNRGTLEFTGTDSTVTFSGNSALGTTTTIYGGAISNQSNGETMSFAGDVVFSDNTASYSGGAVFGYATVTVKGDATFTGNTVSYSGTVEENKGGGAICNKAGTWSVAGNATFADNSATGINACGGAIWNDKSANPTSVGVVNLGNAVFSNNTAESNGGAIYNGTKGEMSLGNATFTGNKVTGEGALGGAIYNLGIVNMANTVTLATDTDTWVNQGTSTKGTNTSATVNWDLTGGTEQYGSIKNFQYYSNLKTELTDGTGQKTGESELLVNQTITVTAGQAFGTYVLATGDMTGYETDETGKYTFTLTGIDGADDVAISVGKGVDYGKGHTYALAVNDNGTADTTDDRLVLTVSTDKILVNSAYDRTYSFGEEIEGREGFYYGINAFATMPADATTVKAIELTGGAVTVLDAQNLGNIPITGEGTVILAEGSAVDQFKSAHGIEATEPIEVITTNVPAGSGDVTTGALTDEKYANGVITANLAPTGDLKLEKNDNKNLDVAGSVTGAAGQTLDLTNSWTTQDESKLVVDGKISGFETVNITNAEEQKMYINQTLEASGDVTISNKGHLEASVLAGGTLAISNTSANTLIGSYTGETVKVTNTSTGKAENVTLQAYRESAGSGPASLTLVGEKGSVFTGDTVIVSGYNATPEDVSANDGSCKINLDGENTFTGTLVMKGGSIGTSGSAAVLNLTDVDARFKADLGGSLTVNVSGESVLGSISGDSQIVNGVINLMDNVTLGAGTNFMTEEYGGELKILGNATLKDGAKVESYDSSVGVSTVAGKTLTLTGTGTALTVRGSFTNKGTIDLQAGAELKAYNGVTNTDATINLKGGTITSGAITNGTVNWVLDSEYTASSLAWSVVSGATTKSITVDADAAVGDTYTLVTDAYDASGDFTLVGCVYDQAITIGGDAVDYNGLQYTLALNATDGLVLSVTGVSTVEAINEYTGGQAGQHTNDDAYTYYTKLDTVAAAAFDDPGAEKGAVSYRWVVSDEWVGYENAKTQYNWNTTGEGAQATKLDGKGVALGKSTGYKFVYLAGYDADGNQVSMNIYQVLSDTTGPFGLTTIRGDADETTGWVNAASKNKTVTGHGTGGENDPIIEESTTTVGTDGYFTITINAYDKPEGAASGIAVTEPNGDVQKYEISTDGGSTWTEYTQADPWKVTDGTYKDFKMRVTDKAGNTTTATFTSEIKVDFTDAEIAGITTTPTAGENGWNTAATITGTASDATSGVAKVEYQVNDGEWVDATGTTSWSVTAGDSATIAGDTYKFRVTDVAGNVNADAEYAVADLKVDGTKAAATITVTPADADGENGWYKSTPTYTVVATDNLSGVWKIDYSTDGGSNWTNLYTDDDVTTAELSVTKTLSVADTGKDSKTYTFRVTDVAGNEQEYAQTAIQVDTIKPDMTKATFDVTATNASNLKDDGTVQKVTDMETGTWITNRADGGKGTFTLGGTLKLDEDTGSKVTPSINVTYEYQEWDSISNSWVSVKTTETYDYPNGGVWTYDAENGDWTLTTTLDTVANAAGTFKIEVSAKDEAGNVSATSATFTGSFDNTMPSNPVVNLCDIKGGGLIGGTSTGTEKFYTPRAQGDIYLQSFKDIAVKASDGETANKPSEGIDQADVQYRYWASTTGKFDIVELGQKLSTEAQRIAGGDTIITLDNADKYWAGFVTEGEMAEDAYNIAFYDQNTVGTYSSGQSSATELSSAHFVIDRTAPTADVSYDETKGVKEGDVYWFKSEDVAVTLTAVDHWANATEETTLEEEANHVSGVKGFGYAVGAGEEQAVEGDTVVLTGTEITAKGTTDVKVHATDNAGNDSTSQVVKIGVDDAGPTYGKATINGLNGVLTAGGALNYVNKTDADHWEKSVQLNDVADYADAERTVAGIGIDRSGEGETLKSYWTFKNDADDGIAAKQAFVSEEGYDDVDTVDFSQLVGEDGFYTLTLHYADKLGNTTGDTTYSIVVDTNAATWTLEEGYVYTVDGGATGADKGPATTTSVVDPLAQTAYDFAWSNNYSFTWALADETSGLASYQAYTWKDGAWVADGSQQPLDEEFNQISIASKDGSGTNVPDLEGVVEKKYVITDKAGNTSELYATLKLDTTIDGEVKLVTTNDSTKVTKIGDVYYVNGDYALEYTETADGKSTANYVYTRTDGTGDWAQNELNANAFTLDGAAADHTEKTYSGIITDAAGNQKELGDVKVVKDTKAATWTLEEGYAYTVDGGATGADKGPATKTSVVDPLVQDDYEFAWSNNYSFTWALADETSGLASYQAYTKNAQGEWVADDDATPIETVGKIVATGNTTTPDSEGEIEKKYVITDKAGNESEFTATLRLDTTIDGEVKLVTKDDSTKVTKIGDVYYVTGDYALEYTETADGKSAANYVYTRTDGTSDWTQNALTANAYTLDGAAADHKAVTYNAIITDAAGNQKTLGDVKVVKDTVGPEQAITVTKYTVDGGAAAESPKGPTTKTDATYTTEGAVTTFAGWSNDYSITVDFSDVTSGYDHYEVEWFLSTDGGETYVSQGTDGGTDTKTVFGNSSAADGIWKNVVTTYDKAGNATTHTYIAKSDKTIDATISVKGGNTLFSTGSEDNADYGTYYVMATDVDAEKASYSLNFAMVDDKKSDASLVYFRVSGTTDWTTYAYNADIALTGTKGTTVTYDAIVTDKAGNQKSMTFSVKVDVETPDQVESLVRGGTTESNNYIEYTQDGQRIDASDWVNTNQDEAVALNVTFNNESSESSETHYVATKFDIAAYNTALAKYKKAGKGDDEARELALADGAKAAGGAWTVVGTTVSEDDPTTSEDETKVTATYNVNEHSTYYFYSKDEVGHVSEYSVNEVKIDNVAPVFERIKETTNRGSTYTAFSVDVTDFGGSDVNADSLKIYNNSDAAVTFYLGGVEVTLAAKGENGDFVAYVAGTKIEIDKNVAKTDTFLFSVNDNAGNKTEETIGALSIESATLDGTALKATEIVWTKGAALLNVTLEGLSGTEFSLNGKLEYWDADQEAFVELEKIYKTVGTTEEGAPITQFQGFKLPEGKYETLTLRATAGGATATRTYKAGVDLSRPTVTTSMAFEDGTEYDGSWTNKDVTVKATFSDTLSGIDGRSWEDRFISDESETTDGTTVTFTTQDVAGNTETGSATVKIDKTAATISATATATKDGTASAYEFGTWTNADVTVKAFAKDNLSGFDAEGTLEKTFDDVAFGDENGRFTVTVEGALATDQAGNVAEDANFDVLIDKNAAAITITANPTTYTQGTVELTATVGNDGFSRQGALEYSLDGGTTWTAGSSVTVSANATVSFRSEDEAGNVSEASYGGTLLISGNATLKGVAWAFTTDGVDDVAWTGDLEDEVNVLSFYTNKTVYNKTTIKDGTDAEKSIGFGDVHGTAKNDAITFGAGTNVTFGSVGSTVDLWAGTNKVVVEKNADVVFLADLANAATVNVAAGTTVKGDDKVVRQLFTNAEFADITWSDANTGVAWDGKTGTFKSLNGSLTTGKYTNVTTGDITGYQINGEAFRTYKLTVGANSTFASGDVTGVKQISVAAGAKHGYEAEDGSFEKGEQGYTSFDAGNVEMTAQADTFTFGNYTSATLGAVELYAGNDKLSVGKFSSLTMGSADFGAGNDTFSVGADATEVVVGNLAFGEGNDTLTIGTGATFEASSINFGEAGAAKSTDKLAVGARSKVVVYGDVTGVNAITTAAGKAEVTTAGKEADAVYTTLEAGDVTMLSDKANTVTLGNWSDTTFSNLTFGSQADKLTIGSNATATFYGKLDFGTDGLANQMTVGARSEVTVGEISGTLNKLTVTAGKAAVTTAGKEADAVYTTLAADGTISGTAKADTFTFGNYVDVALGTIELGDGNDVVKIGDNATVSLDKLDFGDGTSDTLTIGKNSEVAITDLEVASVDKLTIGKESTLFLSESDYDTAKALADGGSKIWKSSYFEDGQIEIATLA